MMTTPGPWDVTARVVDPNNRSVYTGRVVRARKPFACSFCGRTVTKGEQFARTRDYHSSRHYDFRVCRAHQAQDA